MRKIILIIFITNVNLLVYSQLNNFLPDSNAYFSVSSFKFIFSGDTIINNFKYKKVYLQNGDSIVNYNKANYYASVREDTLHEKIYCIQKDDGIERLIADFNVSAEDTISIYSFWPTLYEATEETVVINSVGYLMINGKEYKQIFIDNTYRLNQNEIENWIEGIGSSYGLFFPKGNGGIVDGVGNPYLLCVHLDDTLFYQTNLCEECYKEFETIKINNNFCNKVDFYPTTVTDKIIIRNINPNENYYYLVYNENGQIVLFNKLTSNIIEVLNLKHGKYIILIVDFKNQKRYNNIFIKI